MATGAAAGMNTVARAPASPAANASAWAWLPALAAATPARSRSSGSRRTAFSAPRGLNEPVRWRFSALSRTVAPSLRVSSREGCSGVSRTLPASSPAAAWMSLFVTIAPI